MALDNEWQQMQLLNENRLCPKNYRLAYEQLLYCLRCNKVKKFRYLLEHMCRVDYDVNRVISNESQETLLHIACRKGLCEFVSILLQNGANVNAINEDKNRAAIHYATENGYEDVLQILLAHKDIDLDLLAGTRTALHLAVVNNNLRIATLLVEKGANPNVPDWYGVTAFNAAVLSKKRLIVEMMLEKSKTIPELDRYDVSCGITTRSILMKNMPDLRLPPPIDRPPNVNDLLYYLTKDDETSFLHCLRTMPNDVVIDVDKLMTMTVKRKFETAFSELLERRTTSYNLEEAALRAIKVESPYILRLILNNFKNWDPAAMNTLLLKACFKHGFYFKNREEGLKCIELILSRRDLDMNSTDTDGNSPLHYVARTCSREVILMLLRRGCYVGHRNKLGKPAIADISPSILSDYFDDCIKVPIEGKKDYTFVFEYKCLMPPKTYQKEKRNQQMDVFQYIAGNPHLKHLLKHPLLYSFIYMKWRRLRILRHFNFCLYFIRYTLLWAYMTYYVTLEEQTAESLTDSPHNGSTNTSSVTKPTPEPPEQSSELLYISWRIPITLYQILFLFWKLFQVIVHTYYYWSRDYTWSSLTFWKFVSYLQNELQYGNIYQYVRNWVEVMLDIAGFCLVWGVLPKWFYAVLILSYGWLLMVSSGYCVTSLIYIAMYKTVCFRFFRFLLVYGILIFSFMDAFYILLKANETFQNLPLSIFQTIIMLTGDLNADSELFDAYPLLSRIVFVVFILMIVVVFFNLLVGLAVSDIAEITDKAELVSLTSMIKLLSQIEIIAISMPCGVMPNCWPFKLIADLADRILLFVEPFNGTGVMCDSSCETDYVVIQRVNDILSKRVPDPDTVRIIDELKMVNGQMALLNDKLNSLIRVRPFTNRALKEKRKWLRRSSSASARQNATKANMSKESSRTL